MIRAPDGWFTPVHERFFADMIRDRGCRVCVDLGTFMGDSAICMARCQEAAGLDGGIVYAVDNFKGSPEHWDDPAVVPLLPDLGQLCRANVAAAGMADWIRIVESDTADAVRFLPQEVDLVYIDASHDTESVRADVLAYAPLIRPGGILCGDDWNWASVRMGVLSVLAPINVVGDRIWWMEV